MERNLLEREITTLGSNENSLMDFQLPTPIGGRVIMYPAKVFGKITEVCFPRKEDLKTKEKNDGKEVYYLSNQAVDILGENRDWFLVEGMAAYKEKEKTHSLNTGPVKLKGWVKKSQVLYKIPRKLDEEETSFGYTCYVEIDIGITDKGYRCYQKNKDTNKIETKVCIADAPPAKMTAIYVPLNFTAASDINMIIYLHGFVDEHPGIVRTRGRADIPSIQYYLNYSKKPYFNFREIINSTKTNTVFVAPTLGGKSQYGRLAMNFDNYVDQVIWAIDEYILKERQLQGKLNLKNLIVAAHSGGGNAMLAIAQQSKSIYVKRIKSYWGFDSWYNSSSQWNTVVQNIAKNNKPITIYAYRYNSKHIPDQDKDKKIVFVIRAANDAELVKQTGKGKDLHFPLLPYFFEKILHDL